MCDAKKYNAIFEEIKNQILMIRYNLLSNLQQRRKKGFMKW